MGINERAPEVMLHPQRLAIVRALAGTRLTTKQLAERLPDIPQATLYRHLAQLLEVEVVEVVSERRVRGTSERTYALAHGAILTQEALRNSTPEDHFRYFTTYVAGLLDDFGRYLQRPQIDLESDGVGYRDYVLNLTHDELMELLGELRAAIFARLDNPLTPDRTPRLISTVTLPVERKTGEDS